MRTGSQRELPVGPCSGFFSSLFLPTIKLQIQVPRQKRVKKNKLVCEIPCGNGGGGGGGGLLGGLGGLFNHGGGGGGGGNSNPPCIGSRPSYNRPSYNGGGGGGSGYGK